MKLVYACGLYIAVVLIHVKRYSCAAGCLDDVFVVERVNTDDIADLKSH